MKRNEREVVITGAGVVSPLGANPAALHEALAKGTSALRAPERLDVSALRARLAAEVDFEPAQHLEGGNFRPLDRTGRLAAAATGKTLAAAGWSAALRAEREVGLVLGTMFGSVDTISGFDLRAQTAGPKYAKPLDFANSVINAAAGQAAIWHDLRGINATLAGGPAAGLAAIAYAADAIRSGRADALLAGGCDELCYPAYLGFHQSGRMGGAANGTPPRPVPYDADRNGFALGEGAGFLMLESAESAARRGAEVLGTVRGHASAFDCRRGEDEASASAALAGAVGGALADAGVDADAVDAVSAGANGSVAGDRHEALGLLAALGAAGASVPVTAVKSMLGESLGAAGALQTIALLEALRRGELPGIHGLKARDADLPLTGAQSDTRATSMRRGLVTAAGFDGHVCALVLSA